MTDTEIENHNSLIAVFDGWQLVPGRDHLCPSHELGERFPCTCREKSPSYIRGDMTLGNPPHYNSAWGVLMPVVEKIESLGYKFQICRKRVVIVEDFGSQLHVLTVKKGSKQQSVYKAVVDFINWHNAQSPTPAQ